MEKDFDRWNEFKKNLYETEFDVELCERDVWWCSVGVNVGIKRFTPDVFLAVPLTTKIKEDGFRKVVDAIVIAVSLKNEIPLAGEISEAEANVPIS